MILNSPYISGSLTVTNLSGSGVRYLMTSASGLLISQTADAAIKVTYTASSTAGQTVFPVTNGYSTGLVDVYLNGTKLASSDYSDADGVNITLVTGSDAGDLLEFVKYSPALGVTNNALRQLTTFTSSEGQTVYSASYTPGLLDVYYNGSRLTSAEYTANNGTFITLATGSIAGDIVDIMAYTYQVGAFSGVGGTGVANQVAYWGTTNAITGSPNFTVSGSTLAVTGSFTVMTGSAAEFTVNPTGVNIGNLLTDSHIISGSLRVNPNGLFVSSSGIVGIGTTSPNTYTIASQLVVDAGANGGGITIKTATTSSTTNYGGLFFADGVAGSDQYRGFIQYNHNFNSLTDTLILGTAGTERLYINSSGNIGIGTSSPASKLYVSTTAGATKAYDDLSKTNIMCFDNTSMAAGVGGSITFGGYKTGTSAGGNFAAIDGVKENGTAGNEAGAFRIWTANSGGVFTERMRINSSGYIKASNDGTYSSATSTAHEIVQSLNNYQIVTNTHIGSTPYGVEINFKNADPNNATNWGLGFYTESPSFVWIYRIFSNGTVAARSDARWKKNIETTRSGYLEDLCKLRVVKYNWYNHEENAPKELGLIAQEVEEVFPNLVSYDKVTTKRQVEQEDGSFVEQEVEDGESRSIKTSVLQYMLLKALQEANAKITALEEKLERNNIQ